MKPLHYYQHYLRSNHITDNKKNIKSQNTSRAYNRDQCTWFSQSMGYVHQAVSSCNIYLSRIITICNVIVSIISSYRMKDYDWLKVILYTRPVLLQFSAIASTQTWTRYITPNISIWYSISYHYSQVGTISKTLTLKTILYVHITFNLTKKPQMISYALFQNR